MSGTSSEHGSSEKSVLTGRGERSPPKIVGGDDAAPGHTSKRHLGTSELAATMRSGHAMRQAMSHSPSRQPMCEEAACRRSLTARGQRSSAGNESVLTGYGERYLSPRQECSIKGDMEVFGDFVKNPSGVPRRKVADLSLPMQNGQGVRQALSHSPPRCYSARVEVQPRRSLTARGERLSENSVLTGHGERSSAPRPLCKLRGEGAACAERSKSSSGIPWRQLPVYNCSGYMTQTNGCALRVMSPCSSATLGNLAQKFTSGAAARELIAPLAHVPDTPVVTARSEIATTRSEGLCSQGSSNREMPANSWLTAGRERRMPRAAALALSAAARASDAAMEMERARCLAKFQRLCVPTPRSAPATTTSLRGRHGEDRREVHFSYRQQRQAVKCDAGQCPFARSDSVPPRHRSPPARRTRHSLPSQVFALSHGTDATAERLVPADTKSEASRTWQLRKDLAKIGAPVRCIRPTPRAARHSSPPPTALLERKAEPDVVQQAVLEEAPAEQAITPGRYPRLLTSIYEKNAEVGGAAVKECALPGSPGDLQDPTSPPSSARLIIRSPCRKAAVLGRKALAQAA